MGCFCLQVNDMAVINALWFISTSITPVPCAPPAPLSATEPFMVSRLLLLSTLLLLNVRPRRLEL